MTPSQINVLNASASAFLPTPFSLVAVRFAQLLLVHYRSTSLVPKPSVRYMCVREEGLLAVLLKVWERDYIPLVCKEVSGG